MTDRYELSERMKPRAPDATKRVRIVSDGTPLGTKVFNADGTPMDMGRVTKVEWSIEADGIGVARVTLRDVEIDTVAQARE
jgi:hypothetical protein